MGQSKDQATLAFEVLGWMICAKRPLSVAELQTALGIEPETQELDTDNCPDIETMLSACAGLVTVEKMITSARVLAMESTTSPKSSDDTTGSYSSMDTMRLVHYTTQEYLHRTQQQWDPGCQHRIARACTTFLSFDRYSASPTNFFGTRLHGSRAADAFYSYAALNWGHHARLSPRSHSLVMDFLSEPTNVEVASQELWPSSALDWCNEIPPAAYKALGLHLTAYFGLESAAKALLQQDLDVDFRNGDACTPLMIAAQSGAEPIVNVLLAHHARVDLVCKERHTALYYAARNGCEAIARLLIAHGALDEFSSVDSVNSDSTL